MEVSAYTQFKNNYLSGIMDIIEVQRKAYPKTGLHGYAHIARCLILTHALAKLHKLSYEDEMKCLIAIGLHDSAREDDGEDLWEKESGRIAMSFCAKNAFDFNFQEQVYDLITKKTYVDNLPTANFVVCHDADCLDIIRCFGIDGFDANHFASFKGSNKLREDLIEDTCKLIDSTYLDEWEYDNKDSLSLIEKNMKGVWNDRFDVINPFKK